MATPELPDEAAAPAWYFNRGIPLGIIIYLIVLTIGGTAYITNLADRIAHLEAFSPAKVIEDNQLRHAELMTRLAVIETKLIELQKQFDSVRK